MPSRLANAIRRNRWTCLAIVAVLIAVAVPAGCALHQYHSNSKLNRLLQRARFGGGVATHAWSGRVDRWLIVLSDTQYGPLPAIGEWLRDIWLLMGEPRGISSNGAGCDPKQILPRLDSAEDLKWIDLTHAGEIGVEMGYVADCTRLERLWLRSMHIQPEAVRFIASMASIEDLDLHNSTGIDDDAVGKLANLPRLRRLNLTGTALTDVGIEHLRSQRNLEFLWLLNTRITDASVPALIEIAPDRLSVGKTGLTADGVTRLTAALPAARIDSDYSDDAETKIR